jgi:hypothetical protein
VVRLWVSSRILVNEDTVAHWGAVAPKTNNKTWRRVHPISLFIICCSPFTCFFDLYKTKYLLQHHVLKHPQSIITLMFRLVHLYLNILLYTVLVSTQHFLKSLQIFIRNVFKRHWLKHIAKIHNRLLSILLHVSDVEHPSSGSIAAHGCS